GRQRAGRDRHDHARFRPADRQPRRAQDRSARARAGRALPRRRREGRRLMLRLATADPDFRRKFARLVDDRRESREDVSYAVADIRAQVRARGDAALVEYTQRFDKHALTADSDWRIAPETC